MKAKKQQSKFYLIKLFFVGTIAVYATLFLRTIHLHNTIRAKALLSSNPFAFLRKEPIDFIIGFQSKDSIHINDQSFENCVSRSREPSFWSQSSFALAPPSDEEVLLQFYKAEFNHCSKATHKKLLLSSPSTVMQPWIAKALKLHIPHANIVVHVSDPIERSVSETILNWEYIKEAPSLKIRANTTKVTLTEDLYHELVVLELSIMNMCGVPFGEGYLREDWETALGFNFCCLTVAKALNYADWPGCDAYGIRNPVLKRPPIIMGSNVNMQATLGLGKELTPFGGKGYMAVREGVFIQHLDPWIKHFGIDSIYVAKRNILNLNEQKKQFFHPKDKTISLLKTFYQPHNKKLNEVFGRDILDTYDT